MSVSFYHFATNESSNAITGVGRSAPVLEDALTFPNTRRAMCVFLGFCVVFFFPISFCKGPRPQTLSPVREMRGFPDGG